MEISSEVVDGVTVVRLEGNLDTDTSTDTQDFVNRAIDDGATKILVSLEKVDFVSSAGLRILLASAKRLGGVGGNLRVCALNETVHEIFEISGFSTILSVFTTEAEAVSGF